ncbi:putative cupin superfamily protein [Rhizobium halophytocola]|uniref:Cupin superfamily protein n=1 Tax=Rhizobium halophytocola TaxID=735519 RepID=A0ABS4DWX8_9HYPH|nr:putative cupin superfamily protein [Rhizobium halophytocola]
MVGETPRHDNRIFYPRNPEQRPRRRDWWDDWPGRTLGDHDGLPDKVRAQRAAKD